VARVRQVVHSPHKEGASGRLGEPEQGGGGEGWGEG
jgi:hypothetical protein